jgi:hypothetical protein
MTDRKTETIETHDRGIIVRHSINPSSRDPVRLEIAGLPVSGELLTTSPTLPVAASVHTRKRRPVPLVQERYRRIREIPRDLPIAEYLDRLDAMQRPFRTKEIWQKEGCPVTYGEAFKDPRWQQKIYNERQNAWREPHEKHM